MSKTIALSLLAVGALISGCATSSQSTSATGRSDLRTLSSSSTASAETGQSVWVDPPTGSHIGGGFVRVPGAAGRNDEAGLVGAINSINAAEGRPRQQPFALAVASQISGLGQAQLLTQQSQTHLRLGDLLTLNLLARNQTPKVNELAGRKTHGRSWAELAKDSGTNIAALAQKVRRADELTAKLYVQRSETGAQDVRNLTGQGAMQQGRPIGGGGPVGP